MLGHLADQRAQVVLAGRQVGEVARFAGDEVGEAGELVVELAQVLGRGAALAFGLRRRALHAFDALGGLLEQGLYVGGHVAFAFGADAGGQLGHVRQPVLELVVEAVLRVAGLQVEEADHQRTGEAEERGREARRHAAERRVQLRFQRLEHGNGIAADAQVSDDLADGTDGGEQTPEGAEQAQEDQEADQVARKVALLLEADLHAVEDGAGGRGREVGLAATAVGQHARHRGEQHRLQAGGSGSAVGLLELLDPQHLALQAPDLAQVDGDAHREHEEDHAVECGVGDEGVLELRHQGGGERRDEGEKDGHPGRDMDGFGEVLAFHREIFRVWE